MVQVCSSTAQVCKSPRPIPLNGSDIAVGFYFAHGMQLLDAHDSKAIYTYAISNCVDLSKEALQGIYFWPALKATASQITSATYARIPATSSKSLLAFDKDGDAVQLDFLPQNAFSFITKYSLQGTLGKSTTAEGCCRSLFWDPHAESVVGVSFSGSLHLVRSDLSLSNNIYPASDHLRDVKDNIIGCAFATSYDIVCVLFIDTYSVLRIDVRTGTAVSRTDVYGLPANSEIVGIGWSAWPLGKSCCFSH